MKSSCGGKSLSDDIGTDALRRAFDEGPDDKAAFDAWLALSSLASGGVCAVSLPELAERMRVSSATAKKCVRRLIACGLVAATRVMSGGRVLTTRYTLSPKEALDNG